MVAIANPLDYHTYIWNKPAELTVTYTAMLQNAADLSMLVLDFPHADLEGIKSWYVAIEALIVAQRNTGAAVAVVASLAENLPEDISERLIQQGIAPMHGIAEALDAVEAIAAVHDVVTPTIPALVSGSYPQQQLITLTEFEAKQRLRRAGVDVAVASLVYSAEQALETAHQIGYPVVLKVSDAAHKTDIDGVVVNLQNDEDLLVASEQLLVASNCLLIEPYHTDSIVELLVGVVRDASGFMVLTVGAGGVLTELIKDTRSLLLPFSTDQLHAELESLQIAKLFRGYRNKPPLDMANLVHSIESICQWVLDNITEVYELEVNPLVCQQDRAVVADALIRIRSSE